MLKQLYSCNPEQRTISRYAKSWKEGTYYVLKTNSWYSFTMDMSDEEAETYASYPSYADYLERRKKADMSVQRFMRKFF